MKVHRLLIGQAQLLPLFFFVPITVGGFLTPGYSALRQQGSEMTLVHDSVVVGLVDAGALLTGVSIIVFGFGMIARFGRRVGLSSILLSIFGLSMMANGIWKMGSPMHGFYAIGFALVLAPALLAYELKGVVGERSLRIAVAVSVLALLYFWLSISGLDPVNYRGLTQRVFAAVTLCWISYVAFDVLRPRHDFAGPIPAGAA